MPIFQIDDILVSSEILTEFFCCDYPKCKGCCCIIGDSGAPLEESECESLETEYPNYSKWMSADEKRVIDNSGFFVIDEDGDMVTPLMCGRSECAYTYFDGDDNCFCAIEKAHFAGVSRFRKPISCWLYPIRVSKLSNGLTALNLHRWHLCTDAFTKGKQDGVRVYQFLKEPLIFAYGEKFYEALCEAANY